MGAGVNTIAPGGDRAFAHVGLYARSATRFFTVAVAEELKRRTGARITLYGGNAQEIAFYARSNTNGVFDHIVDIGAAMRVRHRSLPDGPALVAAARELEMRLGLTLNRLSVSNRHYGRGYALGGFNHPRSRMSEGSSHEDVLRHYLAALGFWEDEIRQRKLTLVLDGSKELAVAARQHEIPFRLMTGSRYRNYHYWAWNEFFENPEFAAAYHAIPGENLLPVELDLPPIGHAEFREVAMRRLHLAAALKRIAFETARYAYWSLRGYEKAKGYYLSENIKYFYRIWAQGLRLRRLATTRLAALEGRPFVFYPLQVEPEAALQGLSPEYFCQLALIAAISRDLPAGTPLAVKEHFTAVGRRPADFYRQMAEFKNVVLIDPVEHGVACTRQATATITICGSAGFEAAIMGKPVVAYGRHNIYNLLPHVRLVTDESELPAILREVLAGSAPSDQTRRDGARFLQAVIARSFDMRGFSYLALDRFDSEAVRDACDCLVRSVGEMPRAMAA